MWTNVVFKGIEVLLLYLMYEQIKQNLFQYIYKTYTSNDL